MGESSLSHEVDKNQSHLYMCWRGVERSQLAAAAYRSIGRTAAYIIGGTNAYATMPDDEILRQIPENALVTIIYGDKLQIDSKIWEYRMK